MHKVVIKGNYYGRSAGGKDRTTIRYVKRNQKETG